MNISRRISDESLLKIYFRLFRKFRGFGVRRPSSSLLHHFCNSTQRWSIEELFRKLKTSGFHWENTHMKISARLVTPLVILGFALLMACVVGYGQDIPWKKTLGYPLYGVLKQEIITLQFLTAKSLTLAIQTLQISLQNLKNVLL